MLKNDKPNYIVLCRGGAKQFKDRKSALLYASKKEYKGYSVRVYRVDYSDSDNYDVLYCIYYTGVDNV